MRTEWIILMQNISLTAMVRTADTNRMPPHRSCWEVFVTLTRGHLAICRGVKQDPARKGNKPQVNQFHDTPVHLTQFWSFYTRISHFPRTRLEDGF